MKTLSLRGKYRQEAMRWGPGLRSVVSDLKFYRHNRARVELGTEHLPSVLGALAWIPKHRELTS